MKGVVKINDGVVVFMLLLSEPSGERK